MTTRRQFLTTAPIESRVRQATALRAAQSWPAVLANWIARLIDWIQSRHRARRAFAELTALDARMLADIGLSREAVEPAARCGRLRERRSDRVSR
jgi:uncharacterized protein YjiS (DUF1127 family)